MKHVWLPTLRVWAQAQVPQEGVASDSAEPSAGVSAEGREDCEKAASCSMGSQNYLYTGRRERRCPDDPKCSAGGVCQNGLHCNGDLHSHHHLRVGDGCRCPNNHCSGQDDPCDSRSYCQSSDELHQTCPICLMPIAQSDLAVLRWCMHRFCITCIEKWSFMQRFCPLCKQIFHGWYYNIQSSSRFGKVELATASSSQSSIHRRMHIAQVRTERCTISRPRASKPSPWRRSFKTTWNCRWRVAECGGDNQALQWRGSIYKKNLRAIPFVHDHRVKLHEAPLSDPERKARIERRLEPWIHRELQAILGDSDHSLLVHLVLSLWLQFLSQRERESEYRSLGQRHDRAAHAGPGDAESSRQLEPFLQEKAATFWHELRCFAESPYSLRAYDSVSKYERCRE